MTLASPRARTHACPCGCIRQVSSGRLACPTGWAWLKSARPDLADAVNAAWAARNRRANTPEQRADAIKAHLKAVEAAARWFREQREAEA